VEEVAIGTAAALVSEAQHFHGCLFGRPASGDLIRRYVVAHRALDGLRQAPDDELRSVKAILDQRLNAAWIEPWLRRKRGRRHVLTAKLLLIAYLAECSGTAQEMDRHRAIGRIRFAAVAALGAAGLLWGWLLKARHALV
jgi:hypothetical protein